MALTDRFACEDNLFNTGPLASRVLSYNGTYQYNYQSPTTDPTFSFEDGLTNLNRCFRSRYDRQSLGFYLYNPYGSQQNAYAQEYTLSFWFQTLTEDEISSPVIGRLYSSGSALDYPIYIQKDSENNSILVILQHYRGTPLENGSWQVTKLNDIELNSGINSCLPNTWNLFTIRQKQFSDAQAGIYYKTEFYLNGNKFGEYSPVKFSYTYYGFTYYKFESLIDNSFYSYSGILNAYIDRFYFGGIDDDLVFDLNIDELRIYNVYIPDEELSKIYNNGNGRNYSSPKFIKVNNVPNQAYFLKNYQQVPLLEPPIKITLLDAEGIRCYDVDSQLAAYNNLNYILSWEKVDPSSQESISVVPTNLRTTYNYVNGEATLDIYFTSNTLTTGESLDIRLIFSPQYFSSDLSSWKGDWSSYSNYSIHDIVYYDGISYIAISPSTISEPKQPDLFPLYWVTAQTLEPFYEYIFDISTTYYKNDIVKTTFDYPYRIQFYGSYEYPVQWGQSDIFIQSKREAVNEYPVNFEVTINLNGSTVDIANNAIEITSNKFVIDNYLTQSSTIVKIEGNDLPNGLVDFNAWSDAVTYELFDTAEVDGVYYTSMVSSNLNNDPTLNSIDPNTGAVAWREGIYRQLSNPYTTSKPRFSKARLIGGNPNLDLTSTGSGTAKFTFFKLSTAYFSQPQATYTLNNVYWDLVSINDENTPFSLKVYTSPITIVEDTRTIGSTTLFIKGYDIYQTPAINTDPNPGLALIAQLPPDIIASRTLFIYGAINVDTTLFVTGHSTQLNPSSSPTRTLFVRGYDSINNGKDLYISGEPRNIKIPLFLKAQEPISVINSLPLFINSAGVGISQIIAGKSLYIDGTVFNKVMNLFIKINDTFKYSSNVNMFLKSELPSSTSSRSLFLKNSYELKSNTLTLSMKTDETFTGAMPINSGINLFIEKVPGLDKTLPMYISGYTTYSTATPFTLYTANNLELNNNIFLAIPFTEGVKNGSITMYVRGR